MRLANRRRSTCRTRYRRGYLQMRSGEVVAPAFDDEPQHDRPRAHRLDRPKYGYMDLEQIGGEDGGSANTLGPRREREHGGGPPQGGGVTPKGEQVQKDEDKDDEMNTKNEEPQPPQAPKHDCERFVADEPENKNKQRVLKPARREFAAPGTPSLGTRSGKALLPSGNASIPSPTRTSRRHGLRPSQ